MKPISIVAPIFLFLLVFGMILAVLGSVPAVDAAQAGLAVPSSGAASISGSVNSSGGPFNAAPGAEPVQPAIIVPDDTTSTLDAYPGLGEFAAGLVNGVSSDVVGVYVRDIMALPVQQQPYGDPAFVASEHNLLTEFQSAKPYGVVGLLAHNYLSGSRFSQLSPGTEIVLVFGDGRIMRYTVTGSESYQALDSSSPMSDFVDPNDPSGRVMTTAEMFQRVYTQSGQLILQTCFEAYGDPSWGRVFITAEPSGPIQLHLPLLTLPSVN